MAAKKSAKPKGKSSKKSAYPEHQPAQFGRPTKYRPEFCEDLIEHMRGGGSVESFGAFLGEKYGNASAICKDTVYEWAERYPDFSDAKKIGTAFARKFYEDIGKRGMKGEYVAFNSTVWVFSMKNRFGWRDKVEHSGEIRGNSPVPLFCYPYF